MSQQNTPSNSPDQKPWIITYYDLAQLCQNYPDRFSMNELKSRLRTIDEKQYLCFDHYLYLYDNAQITHLPDGLRTSKSLIARNCKNLQSLPEGLTVGIDLDVSSCPSLRHIPREMQVKGDIYAYDTGLSLVASAYTRLRALQKNGQIGAVFGLPITLDKIDPDMKEQDVWQTIAADPTGGAFLIRHYQTVAMMEEVRHHYQNLLAIAMKHMETSSATIH